MSTFGHDGKVYFVTGLYANLSRTSNLFSLDVEPDYFPILFPNPTDEKGKVYYLPNSSVQIFNQIGELVVDRKTDFDGYFTLPSLSSGIYIIQFPRENERTNKLRWLVR